MTTTTLTIRVPADLLHHAQTIAAGRDETISKVLRSALRRYIQSGPAQLELEAAISSSKPKRRS